MLTLPFFIFAFAFLRFTFYFRLYMHWQTSRRRILLDRPLVMGILNVTPDSFSDGGRFGSLDAAIARANEMISEGVDIIDIGGESTRPGSVRVSVEEEISRTAPVVEAISKRFDVPISIDTSKADVAGAASAAGSEIINDISGLRWDERIADIAANYNSGLVLMHSRGEFESMHSLEPVEDVIGTVIVDLQKAISTAAERGVGEPVDGHELIAAHGKSSGWNE
jgi:dihydropteroate synthase